MPENYHFINDEHTLVASPTGYVMQWNDASNTPIDVHDPDEIKKWQDAGSPKPDPHVVPRSVQTVVPMAGFPLGPSPPTTTGLGRGYEDANDRLQRGIDATLPTIDRILTELPAANDVAGLRRQLQRLTEAVAAMLLAERMQQPRKETKL